MLLRLINHYLSGLSIQDHDSRVRKVILFYHLNLGLKHLFICKVIYSSRTATFLSRSPNITSTSRIPTCSQCCLTELPFMSFHLSRFLAEA